MGIFFFKDDPETLKNLKNEKNFIGFKVRISYYKRINS